MDLVASTRERRGSSRYVVCTVPWLHSPAVDRTPSEISTRADSMPVTTIGPMTESSGSLAAPAALAIAAGAVGDAPPGGGRPRRGGRGLAVSPARPLGRG